jgi:hypothetical protein
MATISKAPTGAVMMLKAFGLNPEVFDQVVQAVQAVAGSLERIEQKQNQILALLEGRKNGNGNASESGNERQ